MDVKLPFYMAYPTPFLFDDDKIEERDYEYLKSMYPDMAKRILPYVEEECERMEYDGSMIYDEYPDKLQLRLMARRIYDKVMENEKFDEVMADEVEMEQLRQSRDGRDRLPGRRNRVRDFVELLLFQELGKRRNRHRRHRRRNIW